jgi:hypothetical protein
LLLVLQLLDFLRALGKVGVVGGSVQTYKSYVSMDVHENLAMGRTECLCTCLESRDHDVVMLDGSKLCMFDCPYGASSSETIAED